MGDEKRESEVEGGERERRQQLLRPQVSCLVFVPDVPAGLPVLSPSVLSLNLTEADGKNRERDYQNKIKVRRRTSFPVIRRRER